jgi:hypothetical protein
MFLSIGQSMRAATLASFPTIFYSWGAIVVLKSGWCFIPKKSGWWVQEDLGLIGSFVPLPWFRPWCICLYISTMVIIYWPGDEKRGEMQRKWKEREKWRKHLTLQVTPSSLKYFSPWTIALNSNQRCYSANQLSKVKWVPLDLLLKNALSARGMLI